MNNYPARIIQIVVCGLLCWVTLCEAHWVGLPGIICNTLWGCPCWVMRCISLKTVTTTRDATIRQPASPVQIPATVLDSPGTLQNGGIAGSLGILRCTYITLARPRAENIVGICEHADMLLNVSGVNPIRPWFSDIPIRVLIDTDPAFTQIRHLEDPAARQVALKHNVFFSFAENLGTEGCVVPDDGLPWQATRQPVVLQAWPLPQHQKMETSRQ